MNLFLYGTLRAPRLLRAVGGRDFDPVPAQLPGYAVTAVEGDVVPMIRAVEGAVAEGLLLQDVPAEAMERLDLFEGAFRYTLTPVRVLVGGKEIDAEVYLPPEDQLIGADVWSLEAWTALNGEAAVLAAEEMFAREPWPSQAAARRLWPMMEKRAWAKVRAKRRAAPASRRHDPAQGDVAILELDPLRGNFYAMQSLHIRHRQFDGTMSEDLPREVFYGIDAAVVLPYDARRDRVLLVEQFRMGPAMLGDPNPWALEAIAGMVDAREDPDDAALRETREEAGLTDIRLEKVTAFYPSPGSSTDFFHCYIGHCDLPDAETYTGGMDDEHEDLRLHTLPFETAMAMIETGEINIGPLVTLLYWLALHRDRLRAAAS